MGDFGPVIVAVVATLGALFTGWLAARRLSRLGLGDTQLQVNTSLRELAEVERAKAAIWKDKYDQEVLARGADSALAVSDKAAVVSQLRLTQHDLDDCQRQRDDLYSELRLTTRGHRPSPAPHDAEAQT